MITSTDENDRRVKNFKESILAGKIRKVAEKSKVDVQDLTFEQAFDKNLYSDYLQPTFKGVAEYGLSWWEYRNRAARKAALQRKKAMDSVSEPIVIVEDDKKEVPVKVDLGKDTPKLKEKVPGLTLEQARKQLTEIAEEYFRNTLSTDKELDLKIDFQDKNVLKIVSGDRSVSVIKIIRDPGTSGGVHFETNRRSFTDITKAAQEAEQQN